MSLIEKRSERRCTALKHLVMENVYSPSYALEKLEELFDEGKVLEAHYEPLAEWLEEQLIEQEEQEEEESFNIVDENENIDEPVEEQNGSEW